MGFKFIFLIVVDLWCVSFSYTAKWLNFIHTHTYIFIYILFQILSHCWLLQLVSTVPCAIQYVLLPVLYTCLCSVVSDFLWPRGLGPTRLLCPWDFPVKNTGVSCHFLLQGIFPTQGSNLHLLHCKQLLYHWAPGKPHFIYSSVYLLISKS